MAAGCYVHTNFAKPYPPTNGLVVRTEAGAVLIYTGWNAAQARDLGNLADANPAAWPSTIQRVMTRFSEARLVIPCHQA